MKTHLLILCGLPLISAAAPLSHGTAAATGSDNATAAATCTAPGTHCQAGSVTGGNGQCIRAGQTHGVCAVASGATLTQAHSTAMAAGQRVAHDPAAAPKAGPQVSHQGVGLQMRHGKANPGVMAHDTTAVSTSHPAPSAP